MSSGRNVGKQRVRGNVVTVIIGATELQCELDLLQRTSRYFQNGRQGMAYGLPESHVRLDAFLMIYDWMAKPSLVVPPQLLVAVYKACTYLKIQLMVDQFMAEFEEQREVREELSFYMCIALQRLNVQLQSHELRVHKYFLTLVATPEFVQLMPHIMIGLFNSAYICVNSELEVLLAAMHWLSYDYENRACYVERLMAAVRFDCIPLEAVLLLRQECIKINSNFAQLFFLPEIEMILKRAPSHNNIVRYCDRRIWIFDPLCSFHHDVHCPRRSYITHSGFLAFQHALRHADSMHWFKRRQLNPYVHTCRQPHCRQIAATYGRG
ncbi:uncharacterized protein LOC108606015 isoform X2 [Drosophila busckii]|uniref:uncharacterized protein LOC108606015 isoform X2 n=1 Tax=Drosophila busckii TaxID=30019 RepID=UPI00083EB3C4|nr:uncharacterized protein LOC108606015 isoform X2 [Drosophila busckii]